MNDYSYFLTPTVIAATLLSITLLAVDTAIVMRSTVWANRALPRWVAFLPALAFLLLVAHVIVNFTFNPIFVFMAIPIYLATLLLVIGSIAGGIAWFIRRLRKRPQPAPRLYLPSAALALLCAVLLLFGVLRVTQTYGFALSIAPRITALEHAPGDANFSERTWSQGFAGLIETLKAEYPFTAYKELDWDALSAEFAPRIADAEARNDIKAYYRALREFAWHIPDAHIGLEGDDAGLKQAEVGGSYGLTLLRLDDGRLVASNIMADGPAAQAGITPGAEITAWNGTPIVEALAQTPIIWSEAPAATTEALEVMQARFLSRGPVGSQAQVAFRKRGETTPRTATLTAVAAELEEHGDLGPTGLTAANVRGLVLPSGYGYIRVRNAIPSLAGFPDDQMERAVARLSARNVPGIIIDVRDNLGGESKLTAGMLAPFFAEPRLFQYMSLPEATTGAFEVNSAASLTIEPSATQYHGPLAVLIDVYSRSSAEDFALFLGKLPNVTVVGINGTAGAGGVSESAVDLPGGYTLLFPKGQTLDEQFAIQIESDTSGSGGVTPDIRVPLDDAAVDALTAGHDIVLERAETALREQTATP
jgi:carboxyl-terminal processing protease